MIALTPEQCRAVRSAGETFVRLEDPETRRTYVLVDSEVFDRYSNLFEPDPHEDPDQIVRDMEPLLSNLDPEDWEDASRYGL